MRKPLHEMLGDADSMARAGRLSTLRQARLECLSELRDVASSLLRSTDTGDIPLIAKARALLDRLEEVGRLEAQEYGR